MKNNEKSKSKRSSDIKSRQSTNFIGALLGQREPMAEKEVYGVLGIQTNIEYNGIQMELDDGVDFYGYMPIFHNREAAEKHANGIYPVITFQIVQPADKQNNEKAK